MTKKIKLLIFFVSTFLYGFSQTGKITGKLDLKDLENKKKVISNTFIILTSKTLNDTIRLNEDLSFQFENLPSDSFRLSISPHSYPYDNRYIIHLKSGENQNVNIPYNSVCPYEKTKSGICPICKKKDEVIPISYGLLAERIEMNKKPTKRTYYPGGCVISDCQPSWFCERDQKEF